MNRTVRLHVLALVAWLVWCPVAFAISTLLSAPPCHGPQQEAVDCCQPLDVSSAPMVTALPSSAAPLRDAELVLAQPALHRAESRPTSRAAPPAGWGRLYVSVSAFLL